MGSGSYDYTSSATRAAARAASGLTGFDHDAAARRGAAPKLHPSMDVRHKPQRESRDCAGKPPATPVAILLDVTGSMSQIPTLLINELSKLMKLIVDGKVVTDPQLLFGGIGDATCDEVPSQIGEFEADDELAEQHLANLFLEGGGGGQQTESYELLLWFFTNRVYTDAYEKRGEKGLLFVIGDEAPYPRVKADEVQRHFGLDIGEDQTTGSMMGQLQDKWDVFLIRPSEASYKDDKGILNLWKNLLPPERVMQVDSWQDIIPRIAATVSALAGLSTHDIATALVASGYDTKMANGAAGAVVPLSRTAAPVVSGVVPSAGASGGARAERL